MSLNVSLIQMSGIVLNLTTPLEVEFCEVYLCHYKVFLKMQTP